MEGFAFAEDDQGEVGERGEVSASADTAFGGDDGVNARVEHSDEKLDQFRADAAVAFGKDVGAQEEHGAGFSF